MYQYEASGFHKIQTCNNSSACAELGSGADSAFLSRSERALWASGPSEMQFFYSHQYLTHWAILLQCLFSVLAPADSLTLVAIHIDFMRIGHFLLLREVIVVEYVVPDAGGR